MAKKTLIDHKQDYSHVFATEDDKVVYHTQQNITSTTVAVQGIKRIKRIGVFTMPPSCPAVLTRKGGLDRLCQRAAFCVKQESGFVFEGVSV